MQKLTTSLVAALTALLLVVCSAPPAFAHKVLVLSSGSADLDDRLRSVLQNQGHVVTIGNKFTRFSGESLTGQKVVVLLPNIDGSGDMPPAGQNALVNFVSAGGGLPDIQRRKATLPPGPVEGLSDPLKKAGFPVAFPILRVDGVPDRSLDSLGLDRVRIGEDLSVCDRRPSRVRPENHTRHVGVTDPPAGLRNAEGVQAALVRAPLGQAPDRDEFILRHPKVPKRNPLEIGGRQLHTRSITRPADSSGHFDA